MIPFGLRSLHNTKVGGGQEALQTDDGMCPGVCTIFFGELRWMAQANRALSSGPEIVQAYAILSGVRVRPCG